MLHASNTDNIHSADAVLFQASLVPSPETSGDVGGEAADTEVVRLADASCIQHWTGNTDANERNDGRDPRSGAEPHQQLHQRRLGGPGDDKRGGPIVHTGFGNVVAKRHAE